MMVDLQRNLSFRRGLAAVVATLGLCLAAHAAPKYTILHSFTGGSDGDGGNALVLDGKRNVYGASLGGGSHNCGSGGCGLIYELTPGANGQWSETVLYSFQGGSDSGSPNSP